MPAALAASIAGTIALAVLGEHDQRGASAGDQALDVGGLLLRVALRVGADIVVAGPVRAFLDAGLVDPPALLLEMAPADADVPSAAKDESVVAPNVIDAKTVVARSVAALRILSVLPGIRWASIVPIR